MGKLLRIVSVCLGILLLLILAVLIFLTTAPGEEFIKGRLESMLSTEVGLEVTIEKFETNLWSRVGIENLTVNSTDDTEQPGVLYVGRLQARYSIFQLLGETVTLKELSADSVALSVSLDSLGTFGIPLLDAPPPTTEDTDESTTILCIDSISIDRVGLLYDDAQLPLSLELSGAEVAAEGASDGSFAGHLKIGGIDAVYDSLALSFSDIEVVATMDSETIHLDQVVVVCEGLGLEASGKLGLADPKNVALNISVHGSLDVLAPKLASAFDLPPLTAGQVETQIQVDGTTEKPLVRLNADVRDVEVNDVDVPNLSVAARYRDNNVLIDTIHVFAFGGSVSGMASASLDSLGATSLSLDIDGVNLASVWQAIYAEDSPYQGRLDGRIDATGSGVELVSWTVGAVIDGSDISYLNRAVPPLECTAELDSSRAVLSLTHGTDKVHAEVRLEENAVNGAFDIVVPDLTALARFVDRHDLSGSLQAEGTLAGTYANPTVRAAVVGSNITYRNFPVDTAFALVSYADSSLAIDSLFCKGSLDSIDTRHPPFDIDSLGGSLNYMCLLRGDMDSLSGGLTLLAKDPRFGTYAVDSLSVNAELDGSRVALSDLKVSHGDLGARLNATYDTLSSTGSFDLSLHPLSEKSNDDEEPTDDTATMREDFGAIEGEFTLQAGEEMQATVRGQRLWLGLISQLTEDSTLSDGEISFELVTDGPYMTPTADMDVAVYSLRVADYAIDSMLVHLRLIHEVLHLDSLLSYALGHDLRASGSLELAVSSGGYLEMREDAPITASLDTRDFDLSALQSLILPEGELSGTVSASLAAVGTLAAPQLGGRLTVNDAGVLMTESTSSVDNINLSLSFADSVLTIDSAACYVSDISLNASGTVATSSFESASVDLDVNVGRLGKLAIDGAASNTEIDLEVTSDSLNLAVFEPFVPDLDSLNGRLGCHVKIIGEPAAPQVDGSLHIGGLSFRSPLHHMVLSEGTADVRFDKNRMNLESMQASLNGGRVTASGFVAHDQGHLSDIELSLTVNEVTLNDSVNYSVAVTDAALHYGRQQENYVLDGDIVLGEARLTAGLRLSSILPWAQSLETVDTELPELIARTRLDVRIRESDQLWIDNNLARTRLHAELGVIGTPLRPNFTGLLQIEEGYLLYLDRRFNVNEGSVFFNDPTRFNPDVKLDAGTQVTVYRRTSPETYKVYIRAEGLLDQLQYGLYSEPPLDKADIVALLTLGATRSELVGTDGNNGGSGLTGVLKDRAAMLTSRRVSGYLSRRAGSLFGFDEFTIEGNLFKFDESWGPQLVASKRLSERVEVTYSTTVGHLNDQTVRLGYRWTDRWTLQGETDRQGRAGLDLKYGFRFR